MSRDRNSQPERSAAERPRGVGLSIGTRALLGALTLVALSIGLSGLLFANVIEGQIERSMGEHARKVGVFGTGETQWGEEYWCGALRRMAAFFGSRYPRLEIEQMPLGERDALKVRRWTDHVLGMAAGTSPAPESESEPDNTSRPHADPARLIA